MRRRSLRSRTRTPWLKLSRVREIQSEEKDGLGFSRVDGVLSRGIWDRS